jgi:hypothetical protein
VIYSPFGADFQWQYSNVETTRLVAGWGTAHAAANTPSFSNYATLVANTNITTDVYLVELIFSNGFLAAATRNVIINIGVDTAGGTNFITKIPSLIAGHAGSMVVGGGITYIFPLYIPSGSSIGIQASANTAYSFSTAIKLYGQPSRPDAVRVGSYVTSFGVTGVGGSAITIGGAAEGTYTQVGTATTRPHWWWQMAYTFVDTSIAGGSVAFDMAAGSSTTVNKQLMQNVLYFQDSTERINNQPCFANFYNNVPVGENIYIRGQGSGAAESGTTVAAYGLGG